MSVDNHKHCQTTVLAAKNHNSDNDTEPWKTLSDYSGENLPNNWLDLFGNNTTITDDFVSVLKVMNQLVSEFDGKYLKNSEDTPFLKKTAGGDTLYGTIRSDVDVPLRGKVGSAGELYITAGDSAKDGSYLRLVGKNNATPSIRGMF